MQRITKVGGEELMECPQCKGTMYWIKGPIIPQVCVPNPRNKEFFCSKCKHMEVVLG